MEPRRTGSGPALADATTWPLDADEYRNAELILDDLSGRRIIVFPFAGFCGKNSNYRMKPRQDLVDRGFCLAGADLDYLVYLPQGSLTLIALLSLSLRESRALRPGEGLTVAAVIC